MRRAAAARGPGRERLKRLLVHLRDAASRDVVVIASMRTPSQGDEVVDRRIAAMKRDYVARLERLSPADGRIRWVELGFRGCQGCREEVGSQPRGRQVQGQVAPPTTRGILSWWAGWVEAIKAAEGLGLIQKPDEI
ncbi:hypothetical protein MCOR25_004114 [Pyricularia grisea]|uniref:Uncharacterized protein n=1 Tax=Pyricularia grisea TaxID=148305 RepID=A0A6P8AYQ8_PYRGI|nr:hypothetical protein PgNI_10876 [Pyricularia grisea]KAI6370823.1 hypothetical protein MCOR25_004114 [Pyricularia grisea]TLD07493.1 hypothetical protein PgNI_10876 [Pyricularia grisea]